MTADILRPARLLTHDRRQALRFAAALALLLGFSLGAIATFIAWLQTPALPWIVRLSDGRLLVYGGTGYAGVLPGLVRALAVPLWLAGVGAATLAVVGTRDASERPGPR